MPLYEYRCVECDNQYEKHEGFDAPSSQPCPKCGGRARRVYSPTPIVFKGSGWYVTDSRKGSSSATVTSPSSGERGSSETPAASSSTSSSTSSSEPAKTAAADD